MTLDLNQIRGVSPSVRLRGLQYFQGHRVSLQSCGPEQVEAVVSGSDSYDVRLSRESNHLRASCSCPYFADRAEVCKHVWATLLAADEKGGLRGASGSLPQTILVNGSPPSPLDEKARREADWREILNRVRRPEPAAAAPPRSKDLFYFVDVPESVRRQQLTLDIMTGTRTAEGTLKGLSRLRLTRAEIPLLPDAADREILSLLTGVSASSSTPSMRWSVVPDHGEIPGPAVGVLLPLLCATGRCRLRTGAASDAGEPLAWDGDEPWQFWMEIREEPEGDCGMTGSLRRGDRGQERLPLAEPALLLPSGLVFLANRAGRLDSGGAFSWLLMLRRVGTLRVPATEKEDLLERLLAWPVPLRIDLPESLRFEEARPVPRPMLRLSAPTRLSREWLRAVTSFVYDGREVPALASSPGIYHRETRRLLLRNPDAERQAILRLTELGFRPEPDEPPESKVLRLPPARVPAVVRTLLAEGWSVEAQGKLYRSAGTFRLGVSSGVDWFELHGEAEFGGQMVALPQLLAAIRRGEGFVPLGDGSQGILPEEWIQKLQPLAGLGSPEDDHLRFQPNQAALLDAWLAEQPEVTWDEAFGRARQRLHRFEGIEPAEAPPNFQGELRNYQLVGLGWLHFLRDFGFGGCLADDMGLGKTVQVLALLESRREMRERESNPLSIPPSLVVVPKSLVFNWIAEAKRFTPKLRILEHTGIGRGRQGDPFDGYDVVLTTYGTLRRDVPMLRKIEFDYLILDEAQAIKNADSQTAKAARLLRGRHRLALSGTPVENHLGELWSLVEFLNPGLLGASPLLRSHTVEAKVPGSENREMLARAVRPFFLRRTKEQVASELPPKIEQTLLCELPTKQRRLYDELRDHYRAALASRIGQQGLGSSKIMVLEALLRLRQAACHPGLLDPERADEPSAKLDLLLPQLREIVDEGHKVLVFSQFTSFLALLRRQLDSEEIPYLYLDGKTRDRQEKVEQFQSDPAVPLFLISLKAGGLGLNLTAADYVYLLDPWWNPAVEAQAIDRAHRIGQTRPVFASRIVARDTVEEKILELQKSKRELADAIIQADQSLLAALSREDLEMLLS